METQTEQIKEYIKGQEGLIIELERMYKITLELYGYAEALKIKYDIEQANYKIADLKRRLKE